MNESSNLVSAKSSELTKENHTEIKQCLNCGELLSGLYCKECGQKDVNYSKPLGSVLSFFFDTWFSVDNRTLRSVFPLFFKPGCLSAQFVAGKRMSFASPIKLYLFSSIIYFFLFNISLRTDTKDDVNSSYNEKILTGSFSNHQDAIKKAEDLRNTYRADLPFNEGDELSTPKTSIPAKVASTSKLADRISEKVKNPDKLKSSFIKGFSYMFIVLMPLFALLLKWIMGKKKRYYFDHLILAVHFHAFALLFFSLLLFANIMLRIAFTEYLFVIVVLYFIVSVKRFYSEKWAKSIAKSLIILGIYGFFFTIVLVSTALIVIAL